MEERPRLDGLRLHNPVGVVLYRSEWYVESEAQKSNDDEPHVVRSVLRRRFLFHWAEGTVVKLKWAYPHVQFTLRRRDRTGLAVDIGEPFRAQSPKERSPQELHDDVSNSPRTWDCPVRCVRRPDTL